MHAHTYTTHPTHPYPYPQPCSYPHRTSSPASTTRGQFNLRRTTGYSTWNTHFRDLHSRYIYIYVYLSIYL